MTVEGLPALADASLEHYRRPQPMGAAAERLESLCIDRIRRL